MVQFQEVAVNIVTSDTEKVGLDTMLTSRSGGADVAEQLAGMETALGRLLDMINTTKRYVDDVVVRSCLLFAR